MHTYAIGDIHGSLKELRNLHKALIRKADLVPYDTLVFVGDYVDRGPDSKGVIDYLITLSQHQKCVFLMGNHEDMMLWYLNIHHGRTKVTLQSMQMGSYWIRNGGDTTMASYGIPDLAEFFKKYGDDSRTKMIEIIGERHIAFLKGLQYFHIEDSNLFVHAGVSYGGTESETPQEAIENSNDEHLLWDRSSFQVPNRFGTMIYGHTPNREGVRWLRRKEGAPYSVGVDVGCVFGANPLTAVRTSDWSVFY